MATLRASWQPPWRWQAALRCPERCSKSSTREAPCPPKAAGCEVMNAIGRDGARWGGRLRVTHSLHSQHPNPPALPPWHDPRARCHQLVATARSPLQCHPNHLPARPPASLSIQGGIATRKSQIKPWEEMPQLSGQTARSCVGAGCFLPHKGYHRPLHSKARLCFLLIFSNHKMAPSRLVQEG